MKVIVTLVLCFGLTGLFADTGGELKYLLESKSYRTKVDMKVCAENNATNCVIEAGAESSFNVLDNTGSSDGNYTVEFTTINPDENRSDDTRIQLNKVYFVKKSSINGLPIN